MMEFFEFFFREPGWFWRFLCLLILLETIGNFISSIIDAGMKCHIEASRSDSIDEQEKDDSATIDDVRS